MLNPKNTKVFDDTGKQIGFIYEMDIRFNSKTTLVEAIIETHCDPEDQEHGGCLAPPYSIKKWYVKGLVTTEDGLEIHLIPQK